MALTADEERQIMMEMAVKSFFDRHFEEISFASSPSNKFHRFYILRAVLEDLSSAGYQVGKIGDFSLDLGMSVAVKDAKMLSQRAGRRLTEYIYGEIVAFEKGEKDVIRGHRASDGTGPLILEGELPDWKAIEERNPDIWKPLPLKEPEEWVISPLVSTCREVEYLYRPENGPVCSVSGDFKGEKPAEKLIAVVHVDGETVKKAVEERFGP